MMTSTFGTDGKLRTVAEWFGLGIPSTPLQEQHLLRVVAKSVGLPMPKDSTQREMLFGEVLKRGPEFARKFVWKEEKKLLTDEERAAALERMRARDEARMGPGGLPERKLIEEVEVDLPPHERRPIPDTEEHPTPSEFSESQPVATNRETGETGILLGVEGNEAIVLPQPTAEVEEVEEHEAPFARTFRAPGDRYRLYRAHSILQSPAGPKGPNTLPLKELIATINSDTKISQAQKEKLKKMAQEYAAGRGKLENVSEYFGARGQMDMAEDAALGTIEMEREMRISEKKPSSERKLRISPSIGPSTEPVVWPIDQVEIRKEKKLTDEERRRVLSHMRTREQRRAGRPDPAMTEYEDLQDRRIGAPPERKPTEEEIREIEQSPEYRESLEESRQYAENTQRGFSRYKITGDKGEYYVVDQEKNTTVGGPFETKIEAKQTIDKLLKGSWWYDAPSETGRSTVPTFKPYTVVQHPDGKWYVHQGTEVVEGPFEDDE